MTEWQQACLRHVLRAETKAHPGTLKHELDESEQYRRDKAALFAWRARAAGLTIAYEVAGRRGEEMEAYRDFMAYQNGVNR